MDTVLVVAVICTMITGMFALTGLVSILVLSMFEDEEDDQ